jgi:hypothetical protein
MTDPNSKDRAVQVVPLPSGTTLTVRAGTDGEEINLRTAGGTLEVKIRLTDDGPVLSLKGATLEIEATDRVAVNCREFSVHAQDRVELSGGDVRVHSGNEIRMKSAAQTYIDGDYVNLNCLDRVGYHDYLPTLEPGDREPESGPGSTGPMTEPSGEPKS